MTDLAAGNAVDVTFAAFGKDASYVASGGGSPTACRVILNNADQDIKFGTGFQFAEGLSIEVRSSEIAAPARGGKFTVAAVDHLILDDPQSDDPERLVWKCRAK